jgi:hypothetical protein
MKFIIQGVEYPGDSIYSPSLGDLRSIKKQTVTDTYPGVTQRSVMDTFIRWGEAFGDGSAVIALLEDDVFTINMQALAWFLKRKAGEQVTFAELDSLSMADIQIGIEPGDVPNPKASSDPVEGSEVPSTT